MLSCIASVAISHYFMKLIYLGELLQSCAEIGEHIKLDIMLVPVYNIAVHLLWRMTTEIWKIT